MIYAVGDIHGYIDQLAHALDLIDADGGPNAAVVFVGDYVDRGPDSKAVVQYLIDGVAQGRNWTVLRGNHDRMFTRFVRQGIVDDPAISSGKGWLHPALGGATTLASYGVALRDPSDELRPGAELGQVAQDARDAIPDQHLAFLENRPLTYQNHGLLFVHAGIRPGIALQAQSEEDLIWIRKGWLEDDRDHGSLVVHGHTALDFPQHHGNRVNIDGGAGYGKDLVPVVFEGDQSFSLSDNGRDLLTPIG